MSTDNSKLFLYRYRWIRRDGIIEGLFITDKKSLIEGIEETVHFGEVLGKYSDVSGEFKFEHLELISDDQDYIQKTLEIFKTKTLSGYNPLQYVVKDEDTEEEHENI